MVMTATPSGPTSMRVCPLLPIVLPLVWLSKNQIWRKKERFFCLRWWSLCNINKNSHHINPH